MTYITILTGKLGSGKTTILNNILRTKPVNKNVEVIINEISPLNVDKNLLTNPYNVTEISNGCTCCTKSEDLKKAIKNSRQERNPDMIIIETTGVANPDNFVKSLNLEDTYHANIVLVIDLYRLAGSNGFGKTTLENSRNATTIILSKSDLVSRDVLEKAIVNLRKANPGALIKTSKNGSITYDDVQTPGKPLHQKIEEKSPVKELLYQLFPELKNQHKSSSQVFSFETKSEMNTQKLEAFISRLPKKVDRAKGIIKTRNGSTRFNYAAGLLRMEEAPGNVKTSKIVLIGRISWQDKINYMREFWKMRSEREISLPEIYANIKLLFA